MVTEVELSMTHIKKSDGHPISHKDMKAALVHAFNNSDPENQSWREFVVERDGDVPLVFDGNLLGEDETSVNALDKFTNSWMTRGHTARIYETKSGKYVVEFISWSGVTSEVNRYKAEVTQSPKELYDALMRLSSKGIPDAALLALRKAAMADSKLKEIAVERI